MRRRSVLGVLGAAMVSNQLSGCTRVGSRREAREKTLVQTPLQQLDDIGLQLSTVTPQLMADMPGTLQRVAQIGYSQVEFSALGFLGRDVQEIKSLLLANNLTAPVGRVSPKMPIEFYSMPRKEQRAMFASTSAPANLLRNVESCIADAKALGQSSLVLPVLMPDQFGSLAQVKKNVALLQQAGELCISEGLRFGYHNHAWELAPVDGVVPYDLMLEETDPAQVTFQLDAYWIRKGGGDLTEYLTRYAGRFSSCHMKDIDVAEDFADVGDGLIDFPKFTREAMAQGAANFFVERDNPPEPMRSIERSYNYLRDMKF